MQSRIVKRNVHKEQHVIGISISLGEHEPNAQYQILPSPSTTRYSKIRRGSRVDSIVGKMIQLGESVDVLARRIGELRLGARILKIGRMEKAFKQNFDIKNDEKLLKASQCYLWTTAGPIAGVLFISDHRVAFCSDRSIKLSSSGPRMLKLYYKVIIPLKKIKRVDESQNVKKPAQKYVQVVTEDNFDFWFMGFLNHQMVVKHLQQAIDP